MGNTKFPHYVLLSEEKEVIAIIAGSENHKAKVTQAMETHYDAEVTNIVFEEQNKDFITPGKVTVSDTIAIDLEEYNFTLVPATMYL